MAGLLDFLNTPQGTGLLSGLAGYAMNARRGTPVNNIGRGLAAGLQGYQGYFDNQQKDAYNKAMSEAAMANAVTARQRAMNEALKAQKDKEDDDIAGQEFRQRLVSGGIDPETGGFIKVSSEATPVTIPFGGSGVDSLVMNPKQEAPMLGSLADPSMSYSPPPPPNPLQDIYKELGWTEGRKKMFEAQLASNPNRAMVALENAYKEYDRSQRKGRLEARDVLAKERAIQEEIDRGTPLGKRLGAPKQPLVQNTFAPDMGKFGDQLGKEIVSSDLMPRREKALRAAQGIDTINAAKKLLDDGMITGKWANVRLGFGKALQLAGINYARDETANTEAFMSVMGREVGDLITMFGSGTGLSDADRDFAQQIAAAKIDLNEQSIRRVLDLNERARRNVIALYNRDAASIKGLPYPLTVDVPRQAGGSTQPKPQQSNKGKPSVGNW